MATETMDVTRRSDGRTVHLGNECLSLRADTGEVCSFASFHSGRHSWQAPAPLAFTASISSLNGKAGPMASRAFELKVFFEDHDATDDAIARLMRQVGRRVSITIVPEAEQQALPLE